MSLESTRRRLTPKQADTIARLGAAALAVLRREGFSGLTIRMVAAEAGVGAATAYTYFSSKEHLITEVFWRRLASAPAPAADVADPATRAVAVLRDIALLVADEPELGVALTAALLGRNPDVEHLQTRIATEIRERLSAALGSAAHPDVVDALMMLWAGALVYTGMGYASFTEMADRLDKSARLILAN
ncbi:MAG: TetR family transcriptional regulator [Mycobacteriaceae bacterium]|nr:TetR family transcriptional regulator [Mycobacteriaceae bacterium]